MSEPKKVPAWGFREIIVLAGLILFFASLAMPQYVGPRRSSHEWKAFVCINYLREIDAAANEFGLEKHLTNGAPINFPNDLTPYIKLNSAGEIPSCPSGGIYSIAKVGEPPTCSLGTTVTPLHVLP